MSPYVISIDQSTQGTKILLLDRNGEIVYKCSKLHSQITDENGWISHDPNEIYNNLIMCIKDMLEDTMIKSRDIVSVGITNQRETSLIWYKESGELVDKAIVWQCDRAKSVSDRFVDPITLKYIKRSTGLDLSPYYPASKFAWLFETHSLDQAMGKGELCCGTIDSYLIYRLSNKEVFKTDYSNASRTQLFNLDTLQWDKQLCSMFHVNPLTLPDVCASDSLFAMTDFEGLLGKKVPIRAVLGDSHAALYAQNCLNAGDTKATYGTGSSIMMNTGKIKLLSQCGLSTSIAWVLSDEINYVLEGNVNYSGAVVTWLQEIGLVRNPKETIQLANNANIEDETYLVPAFSGLGAPHWNSKMRAIYCGMSRLTKREELVKAALESIAYQVCDIVQLMRDESRLDLTKLYVDGGPTSNEFLMQFQSDISNIPIYISSIEELSALGVGIIAGKQYLNENDRKHVSYQRLFSTMQEDLRNSKIKGWKSAVKMASK